jgi:hypothetical protein
MDCVSQVAPQIVEPQKRTGVAVQIHRQCGAAQRPPCRRARIVAGQSAPHELFFEQGEVRSDFAFGVMFAGERTKHVAESADEAAETHSHLKATSGSTRAARRAGRYDAKAGREPHVAQRAKALDDSFGDVTLVFL